MVEEVKTPETSGDEFKETVIEQEASNKKSEKKAERENKKLQKQVKELTEELEASKAELAETKDQFLRKQADIDNFRKRMIRDKEEAIKFANASLLLDIIRVIDDFERAIHSAEESKDFESFHSGIVLIEKQMLQMLDNNWGLKRFDSVGEPFDPERHEAMTMEESDKYDVQTVLEDFLKGYTLNDKIVRHAKVKVSNPVSKKTDQAEEDSLKKEN